MPRLLLIAALVLGFAASVYQAWDMVMRSPPRLMLHGSDDSFYYFWVRSVVVDGDLDFANDLADAPTMEESARVRAQAEPLTTLGRIRNKYPLGWALASAPWFLAAHGFLRLGDFPADGWQPLYFAAIWLGHFVYTAVGLFAARRVLLRFLDREAATIGVLAGWLVGPMLYYQTARASMPHGLAFTLVAVLYDQVLAGRENPGRRAPWLLGGAAAGLLLITRPTCAPYLLFPLVQLGRMLAQRTTRGAAARGLWLAVWPVAALLALPLVAQYQLHGAWRVDTYDSEPFHFDNPQLFATLFSPWHGWLYWHPWLLPGLAAFGLAAVRQRLPIEWLLSALVVVYVNASWWCWWWGSSFGNRAFEAATLFAMCGWGLIWHWARHAAWHRRGIATAIWGAVAANAILLGLFLSGAISRTEPVSHAQMADALWRELGRVVMK
jgi:hypothetical protein